MGGPSSNFAPVFKDSGTLAESFPDVDPNFIPFGEKVLLQIKVAKRTFGESKLELPEEVRQTIQQNTQVAKVISYGPLAFHNRTTGKPWPEGAWAHPGDFVRIPKYGGDRWEVKHGDGVVMFVLLRDLELPGKVPNPLDAIAYV